MLTILLCAVAGCHEPVALIPSRPLRLTGGESWIQLVSRSPGDTIALAACDQGAAGSTALDVFVGPRCGALERHATVYLRCERWSVIRVELDERVHLRARGNLVLHSRLFTGGESGSADLLALPPPTADSEPPLDVDEPEHVAVAMSAAHAHPLVWTPHEVRRGLAYTSDAPPLPDAVTDEEIRNATTLFDRLANAATPLSLHIVGRIALGGNQITIRTGQSVTLWGDGDLDGDLNGDLNAILDGEGLSRVITVCLPFEARARRP